VDIVVSDVTKKYGNNLVLDRLTITFREGELTCIMGPSGCGKTTLLNIMMGLISHDSGTVSGVPQRKSAVFQEDRLCENFNALSNVRLVCGKEIEDHQITAQLKEIGLTDFSKPVQEFSGGMKRRVAIVRAMMAKSDILFFDEPLKGLDETTKRDTIKYIKNNTHGQTVIFVTHNMDEVKTLGGRLITFDAKGKYHED
jgi:NitT/TauT family transport system ATP-binding protein